VLFAFNVSAQKIKVNAFNKDFEKLRNPSHFDFVHQDFDSSRLEWVADLTIKFDTAKTGMIGECYKLLKEKANRFGANGFRVKESDIYKLGRDKFITISAYWIRMENRAENLKLMNDNTVYLFGLIGHHSAIPGYEVTVGEDKMIMNELSYKKFTYENKNQVLLRVGSKSRGAEKRVTISDGMKPKFYYFHMIKGSFKNAWIDEYSPNYGMFLISILKKAS
jgi:hypothetical protein